MKIIRDTREQKGFTFEFYDDVEIVKQKLDYGDYALEGDNDIVIERKANTGEIYLNLATKSEYERFHRELTEMTKYRQPILLCEFPESYLYEFPRFSNIPGDKWDRLKINSARLRQLFYEIKTKYPNLNIVFMSDRVLAEDYVYNLFKDKINGREKKFNF